MGKASKVYIVIYSLGYAFLTFATLAEGKGTFLFASFLLPWILFLIAYALLFSFSGGPLRSVGYFSIVLYYFTSIGIAMIEQSGEGNFERTVDLLSRDPAIFLSAILWYLLGQTAFWIILFRKNRVGEGPAANVP